MRTRAKDLALRRRALVEQAAEQRKVAADAAVNLQLGLSSVERVASILRYLGRKPLVVGLGFAAITLLIAKPRRTVTWFGYAFTAYTTFRRLRRILFPPGQLSSR